ncbi:CsbD family protein [Synechococcus sp. CS-602]|nr:CsbD family protein [Synechococcus sp. CS-603]MCT0204808.1 CsbD family protein [Synechococcus sp. CS-602]MCT0245044.1 CsbD family protein [Synechococcus sp. CS-601]
MFGSNKAKTVAKDVEGKIQESIGLVTGDEGDRLAGKAKQAEANARDTADTLTSKAGMG